MAITLSKSLIITLALGALLSCSEDNKQKKQPVKQEVQQESTEADSGDTGDTSDNNDSQPEQEEINSAETTEVKKGLYIYHEDLATFTDCSNNQTYPVAQEGIYYELEATYLALRDQPQQKLLFQIKGEYDMRAPEEGDDVDMLIPAELIGVVHKESCQ